MGIELLIYAYGVLCLGLGLFNLLYFYKEKWGTKWRKRRVVFWQKTIYEQHRQMSEGKAGDVHHEKLLMKKLVSVSELSAFEKAYEALIIQYQEEDFSHYIQRHIRCFQLLGEKYSKKHPMEKAYFAHFVASCFPGAVEGYGVMPDILVSYLVGSTVYCRENVLQALYQLGNIQGVDHAFRLLNDYRYFHHPKLLADGLMTFTGDRRLLAQTLWKHHRAWNHEIMVAIIQFIMAGEDSFTQVFYEVVDNPKLHIEMRLAIIRYFKKYPYAPMEPILHRYVLGEGGDDKLSIVAAATLENYVGTQTKRVLRKALQHRSWYIRRNAAKSLIAQGMTCQEIEAIRSGTDRFASEMFQYMMKQQEEDVMEKVS